MSDKESAYGQILKDAREALCEFRRAAAMLILDMDRALDAYESNSGSHNGDEL